MFRFLKSPFLEAFGVFGGMIIGSGMFALPYAASVSGLWPALISAAAAFFAISSIHLAYGEVVANTSEKHRLPGYTKFYLGNFFGNLNKLSQTIVFNATLLIYGVLGGIFLSTVFGGSPTFWTLFFFTAAALILLFENIERIGFINFILTIPLIAAILLISAIAFLKGGAGNIQWFGSDPFFSFGIFVFALAGLSVIPDAGEIFKSIEEKKSLKSVIILGTVVPLILYLVFIISMLMALDGFVSEDAVSSSGGILGGWAIILGAAVGFLAVFTSFLVLAYDLRKIYELDIGTPKFLSWALSVFLPALFFISGLTDFVKLISIVGGIFIALDGFFVIFILRKMRKVGVPEIKFLPFGVLQQFALLIIFAASVFYELVYQIF